MEHKDNQVQREVVEALPDMVTPERLKYHEDDLLEKLNHPSPFVRSSAIGVLERMGFLGFLGFLVMLCHALDGILLCVYCQMFSDIFA